ncbi:MAG: hypothetical protein IJU29_00670 [Oscillospiraceae bacterium]|nr:hypothetical protein [Oscillospiraceae bacterium]
MLRKKLWTEYRQLTLSGCLCAAMLLVAALLPLAFRSERSSGTARADTEAEIKAALFQRQWAGDEELDVERVEEPGRSTVSYCEDVFSGLVRRWVGDQALINPISPTGSEYTVTREGSVRLRLCRMWLQARGDWQNWMDVCFDADTGHIYYLYVSRECLTNRRLYAGQERLTGSDVAVWLASQHSATLQGLEDGADGTAVAVLTGDGGTLRFEIRCIWYDTLLDVRIRSV